jgi:microcystin-dependent protein
MGFVLVVTLIQFAFANHLPIGAVVAFAGANAPPGFLECNGASVSQTVYPRLFSALGHMYTVGGQNATGFSLPDYRGLSEKSKFFFLH